MANLDEIKEGLHEIFGSYILSTDYSVEGLGYLIQLTSSKVAKLGGLSESEIEYLIPSILQVDLDPTTAMSIQPLIVKHWLQ